MKIELENSDIEKLSAEITRRVLENLGGAISKQPASDPIYTVETLAAYLNTSGKWVYSHVPTLPHFKLDGLLRFRKSEIDRHISEQKNK